MTIQIGKSYILKGNKASNSDTVVKVQIKDITETSVYLEFSDTGGKNRISWKRFKYEYKVIEEIAEESLFINLAHASKRIEVRGVGITTNKEFKEAIEEVLRIL